MQLIIGIIINKNENINIINKWIELYNENVEFYFFL